MNANGQLLRSTSFHQETLRLFNKFKMNQNAARIGNVGDETGGSGPGCCAPFRIPVVKRTSGTPCWRGHRLSIGKGNEQVRPMGRDCLDFVRGCAPGECCHRQQGFYLVGLASLQKKSILV